MTNSLKAPDPRHDTGCPTCTSRPVKGAFAAAWAGLFLYLTPELGWLGPDACARDWQGRGSAAGPRVPRPWWGGQDHLEVLHFRPYSSYSPSPFRSQRELDRGVVSLEPATQHAGLGLGSLWTPESHVHLKRRTGVPAVQFALQGIPVLPACPKRFTASVDACSPGQCRTARGLRGQLCWASGHAGATRWSGERSWPLLQHRDSRHLTCIGYLDQHLQNQRLN